MNEYERSNEKVVNKYEEVTNKYKKIRNKYDEAIK